MMEIGLVLMLVSRHCWAVEPESATHFQDSVRPVLKKFCGSCHDGEAEESHVDFLSATSAEHVSENRGLWTGVVEQLHLSTSSQLS